MEPAAIARLQDALFKDASLAVHAVLDGATVEALRDTLEAMEAEHKCLYSGDLAGGMDAVAPYLVSLERDSKVTRWILEEGWGRHWGIFVHSRADLRALRRHFRAFLMVRAHDGKSLYFRYYDPRVLRVYLPTCNRREQATVFGPVVAILLEGEPPTAVLRFERGEAAPRLETIPLAPADQGARVA